MMVSLSFNYLTKKLGESFQAPQVDRFKNAGATNEFIERQFYCPNSTSVPDSKFWQEMFTQVADWITTKSQTPRPAFLSSNFIFTAHSIYETILVLSLTNLPFKKSEHTTLQSDNSWTLTSHSNLILFTKTLKEFASEKIESEILLTQKFLDPENLYEYNEKTRKSTIRQVTEFLPRKVYCSRVAITNSSESGYDIQLITEIPQGALPVNVLDYSKSESLVIGPLSAKVVQYYFYFPGTGTFKTFRATGTIDGMLAGIAAGSNVLEVRASLTQKSKESIQDILNTGSNEDILNFLRERNIHDANVFNPTQVLWLFTKDEKFFWAAFEIFKNRNFYDQRIWSFLMLYPNRGEVKE